jgi:hypothetical protein
MFAHTRSRFCFLGLCAGVIGQWCVASSMIILPRAERLAGASLGLSRGGESSQSSSWWRFPRIVSHAPAPPRTLPHCLARSRSASDVFSLTACSAGHGAGAHCWRFRTGHQRHYSGRRRSQTGQKPRLSQPMRHIRHPLSFYKGLAPILWVPIALSSQTSHV